MDSFDDTERSVSQWMNERERVFVCRLDDNMASDPSVHFSAVTLGVYEFSATGFVGLTVVWGSLLITGRMN